MICLFSLYALAICLSNKYLSRTNTLKVNQIHLGFIHGGLMLDSWIRHFVIDTTEANVLWKCPIHDPTASYWVTELADGLNHRLNIIS